MLKFITTIFTVAFLIAATECGGKKDNTMITDREQIEWLKNADKLTPEQEAQAAKEAMAPTPQ